MNRENKIKLLKAIADGKTTIKRAFMPEVRMYYEDENGMYSVHFKNGASQKLTREQLEAYNKKHPAKVNLIYRRQEGNEPIQEINNIP